jgi:histidinol-phosphate aminotransferase
VLNFAFMAFSDEKRPVVFPDITYGFYPVFAELSRIPYRTIPLDSDLKIRVEDYIGIGENIVIANPNAPTGLMLSLDEIERIVASNPDNVVIIDEAYVDFGGESAIPLTEKYDNLLVTGTFSKSRSMAGARLGFGISAPSLIADLNTIKYSTNPYNVNAMTQATGFAALEDNDYYMANCKRIIETREYTEIALRELGFEVIPSKANFVFAKSDKIGGGELYSALRERGILVRHFNGARISEYNRITIGTRADMETLVRTVGEILSEKKGR